MVDEIFPNCTKLPDILSFTETALGEYKHAPDIPGYEFEHSDSMSKNGGVGLYISDKLGHSLRPDLSIDFKGSEDLWVDITIKANSQENNTQRSSKFVVGVVYRHPTQNYKTFCKKTL